MALRPVDPSLLVRGSDEDPRLGRRLQPAGEPAHVALVGCPDDTGIAQSGGRIGAAQGPTELRRWIYKQTTGLGGELETLRLADLGDVVPDSSIEATHEALERAVLEAFRVAPIVVLLGGGHDLAYASQSAALRAHEGRAAIVNVDTHLDVRPLKDGTIVTSGTPFRRVLERFPERVGAFVELGIQPQHNARAHAEWVRSRNGRIVSLEELRAASDAGGSLSRELANAALGAAFATVSLDLDVLAADVGPGVSAPPGDGLDARSLVAFLGAAGRHPKVRLLDVVELSPPHDENGRTARTAALGLWRFFEGILAR